jgi:hypothetical protein
MICLYESPAKLYYSNATFYSQAWSHWATRPCKSASITNYTEHSILRSQQLNTQKKLPPFYEAQKLDTSLFWNVCNVNWQLPTFCDQLPVPSPSVKQWTSWHLEMGRTDCPNTPVTNCQSMLRNIPEEQESHLHLGESLKSRKTRRFITVFTQASHFSLF